MAATHLFCYFVLSKNRMRRTADSRRYIYISFYRKGFINFNKRFYFPLRFETCFILILSIYLSKIYLRSCSNLLIDTNPRPFSSPLRNSSILYSSSSIMYYFHYTPTKMQCRFEWNRTNDVESRASFIRE